MTLSLVCLHKVACDAAPPLYTSRFFLSFVSPRSHSPTKRDVLEQVEEGYRMPKPDGCPDALFTVMFTTWDHDAEKRPTFEYLKSTLEDYYVSAAEGAYKEPGAG